MADFLFSAPLYAEYELEAHSENLGLFYNRGEYNKIDGYCPDCERETTFTIIGHNIPNGDPWNNIEKRYSFDDLKITCARSSKHSIRFWFRIYKLVIQKVGQFPSLADIAIEEMRQRYKAAIKREDWPELYKAIGLAAHGEGIGSFVYLRRIFERLILSRFMEYKDAEGWSEEDFRKLRMDERVGFLHDHLPQFLVENRKVYSIFSQGIHELDNETCLQFFDVGKESIAIVLEEDLKKKQELERRDKFKEAIAKFGGKLEPAAKGDGTA